MIPSSKFKVCREKCTISCHLAKKSFFEIEPVTRGLKCLINPVNKTKDKNKEISSKRVLIEHAIGGVKILRMVKDEIRIYKETTRNLVMKTACAIHNLKINLAYN